MYKLFAQCALLFFSIQLTAQSTSNPVRVSFTLANPGLSTKVIDIRYFDYTQTKASGYGYHLGGLSSHAVNMPAGTRIYEKRKTRWQLIRVITAADAGQKINLGKTYEISHQQWLDAAWAEKYEEIYRLEKIKEQPEVETFAQKAGLDMVTFKVVGKSMIGKQVYVRAEIPGDEQNFNVGFSRKLNWSSVYRVSYPVGTKLYRCEAPYWEGKRVKESLILTVDKEKNLYLIRI